MTNFYSSGGISIDDDFARFGDKAFAVDKINTVDVRSQTSSNYGFAIGAAGFLTAVMVLISNIGRETNPSLIFGCLAAMLIFGGIVCNSYRYQPKTLFTLVLMTSSSEMQALQTTNREQIKSLKIAIEQAMVAHRRKEVS